MQLVTTVSSIINGGHRITPHFGVKITGEGGKEVETLRYETKNDICTKETSETMRYLLERVVSDGSGKNAKIEGVSIGGKTATSQTLREVTINISRRFSGLPRRMIRKYWCLL